jgi:hypothetical protein
MSAVAESALPRRRNWLGWPGLVVALIGLALTVCRPWVEKLLNPPLQPPEELVADIASRSTTWVVAKLRGEKLAQVAPEPDPYRWSRRLPSITFAISFVGLALGAFGLICHEHIRVAAAAVAVSASAIVILGYLLLGGSHSFW